MSGPANVAKYIFFNGENELRSGWRVLVFLVLFLTIAALIDSCASLLIMLAPSLGFLRTGAAPSIEQQGNYYLVSIGFNQLINLAAVLAASWACARLLEHRSLASIGYKLHRGWLKDFSLGSILGALALALAVGIAAIAGAVRFEVNTQDAADLTRGFLILFVIFLMSGAFEELLFRGFAFQALVHNIGAVAAILISATLFGLAHLSNSNASAFSTINTILAGVWLGLAYLKTRSLWLATALHYSWNFVMAFVFGLPVSGITLASQHAWLRGSCIQPEWISGGDYGPEGGAATTIVLILSTLVIWKSGLFKPAEDMLAAIQHGKPDLSPISISPNSQHAKDH